MGHMDEVLGTIYYYLNLGCLEKEAHSALLRKHISKLFTPNNMTRILFH